MKTFTQNLLRISRLLFALSSIVFNAYSQNEVDPASKLTLGDKKSSETSPEIKDLLHYYDKKIYFTQNQGQWPANVVFKAEFPLGQAVATNKGMLVGTFDPADMSAQYNYGMKEEEAKTNNTSFNEPKVKVKGHAWMMNFLNSSPLMAVESKTKHADVFNYFNSGSTKYKAGVSNYQEVWYKNVYDNVDVRYYPSEEGTLEYDMVCKPGFNKNTIAIQMDGIPNISLKQNGSLVLKTSVGEMTLPAPIAYQKINGKKISVEAHYVISGNNIMRFSIGKYDASQTLIIDPIALRWATLINSNSTGDNHGHCIWVDPSDGAIYVVSRVMGSTDLITPGAFDESTNGNIETIIGKYTEPDSIGGSGARVWQTYVGGNGDDNPYAMEQGPDGNLYITGYTSSSDFPLLGGSDFSGSSIDDGSEVHDNIFVMKISKDGNSIKSSIVGGNDDDRSFDLRFTPEGDLVICGNTRSTNLNTLHPGIGASNTNNGGIDVIVFKINSDLSTLAWIKNYGGNGSDRAAIMLNNPDNGDIYVAGNSSSTTNFPVVNARQSSKVGSVDGFVQKLKSNGTIVWSSYFNSSSGEGTNILCMEFNTLRTKLYFGGTTTGLNASNVSGSGVYDDSYNGGLNDFFVASMDTNQTFNASTYIGGAANEVNMMGLNVDLNNEVYVFGYTNSANFPTTSGALQTELNNTASNGVNPASDKVFLKLTSTLSSLLFSTYYGGSAEDFDPVGERGIKFSNCRIYTIVTTRSNNIPLTEGAITTTKLSSSEIYEPGLVVWANPPDLSNNNIFGNQSVCAGDIPGSFTGSEPSYILPNISRNDISSPYPVTLSSAATYQWQKSNDSINWTNIAGGATQNLDNSLIGNIHHTTYFRRIIGGDACVIAGIPDQSIVVRALSLTSTKSNVTCYGFDNGSITVHANGTPNYSYSWNTGATTKTISNLAPGIYIVTVMDGNDCSVLDTFLVTGPPSALTAIISSTPATCGNSNGTAGVIASGGILPYSYLWSNGSTNTSLNWLAAGIYSITVKDSNACIYAANDTVQQSSNLSAFESHTDILCNGDSSTVTISASGGTAPYTGTGSFSQGAGTVTYTVADAGGCNTVVYATIAQPSSLSASETHSEIVCHGGMSMLIISASGGTGPYTGTGTFAQGAGIITYIVTDANGCHNSLDVTISEPDSLSISESHFDILCHGGSSTVTIYASGGTTPYTGEGSFTQSAGTATYTVVDANGCSAIVEINITQPDILEALASGVNESGFNTNDGSVSAAVTGGTTAYNYVWSNGATNASVNGLSAGSYSVAVTDAYSCSATSSVILIPNECVCVEPANFIADSVSAVTALICWDASPCALGYIVAWKFNAAQGWLYRTVSAPDHCTDFTNNYSAIYQIKVATICANGDTTAYGPIFIFETYPSCLPPTNLYTNNIGTTKATANWTPVVDASHQDFWYRLASGSTWIKKNLAPAKATYKLKSLTPATSYVWKIREKCTDADRSLKGKFTPDQLFTTASIRVSDESDAKVSAQLYPNPASSEFIVELNLNGTTNASFKIQFVNAIGQVIATRTGNFVNGRLYETFQTNAGMADGFYQVQIIWNDQMIIQPVVINK